MVCSTPFTTLNVVHPCGQCLPCRKGKAFDWSARQDIEADYQRVALGRSSSFITLTYAPDQLPGGGSLVPAHGQRFLRTLRQRLDRSGGHPLRFYLCGEYGEKTGRPHYHLNAFGYAPTDMVGAQSFTAHVRAAWGRGFVTVLPFQQGAASYTSGYVVKGLYQAHNPALAGRHPEFRRASRMPGLGAPALDLLAAALADGGYASPLDASASPESMQVGDRSIRLRGYLLKRLRRALNFSDDELRATGRAVVSLQSAALAARRLDRLDEDHGDRALGGNPNVLATAAAIYREVNASALERLTASHHRIEASRHRIF